MLFKKLVNIIYNSEINCELKWEWDVGFTWSLLDIPFSTGCRKNVDDALSDMFDAIIKYFPDSVAAKKLKDFDENKEHFIVCQICGDLIDCRDLGDVFYHENKDELPKVKGSDYMAKKEGDSRACKNDEPIDLN